MAPGNRKNPQRAASSESLYSLMEFQRDFPDDETCLHWLWRTRYSPDGEHALCPRCGEERVFHRYATKQQRQSWTCTHCSLHIHPTAGTVFHKSSTALHLWFYALYLMTSTRCGISAKQLERELGVTYKTAWRIFNKIRNELMDSSDTTLDGPVEMDEMYHGGKVHDGNRGRPGYDSSKVPVFGIVERRGRVMATPVEDVKGTTLLPIVCKRVLPESIVYTDTYSAYSNLHRDGYDHRRINHAEGVYVSGDVHTQTIEGFWSLVKRGISGTYHAVSAKWLQGYLNEYTWRYNQRDSGRAMFLSLILRAARP